MRRSFWSLDGKSHYFTTGPSEDGGGFLITLLDSTFVFGPSVAGCFGTLVDSTFDFAGSEGSCFTTLPVSTLVLGASDDGLPMTGPVFVGGGTVAPLHALSASDCESVNVPPQRSCRVCETLPPAQHQPVAAGAAQLSLTLAWLYEKIPVHCDGMVSNTRLLAQQKPLLSPHCAKASALYW
jgi:hypothetical protein